MSSAATSFRFRDDCPEPQDVTLLELVQVVGEVTEDDREVVATILEMLRSGRVRLCGNFRGVPIDRLR